MERAAAKVHRIVFLDRASVDAVFRSPSFPHQWIEYSETAPEQVGERLAGATIAVTNKVPLRARDLEALAEVELVAVAATGVDVVDIEAARKLGIIVSNVRQYAKTAVPEHAIALMLALKRNLFAYRRAVESGEWGRSRTFCLLAEPIEDLAGSTLGVIGYGALGQATAQLASAFGMRVLVAERKGAAEVRAKRTAFDRVIAESDILTLHTPLDATTRSMIGRDELERMKRSAILINTARGGLVDEAALAGAIRERKIAGFGFDVLEKEPPREPSPLLALADQPNVLITPHIAWASRGAMQRLADQLIDNIEAFVRGTPQNVI